MAGDDGCSVVWVWGAARNIWVACLALFTAFQRVMGCPGSDDE